MSPRPERRRRLRFSPTRPFLFPPLPLAHAAFSVLSVAELGWAVGKGGARASEREGITEIEGIERPGQAGPPLEALQQREMRGGRRRRRDGGVMAGRRTNVLGLRCHVPGTARSSSTSRLPWPPAPRRPVDFSCASRPASQPRARPGHRRLDAPRRRVGSCKYLNMFADDTGTHATFSVSPQGGGFSNDGGGLCLLMIHCHTLLPADSLPNLLGWSSLLLCT